MGGSTIKASGLPMANTLTLASSLPVAKTRPDFFPSWMLVIFSPLGSLPSSLGKKKKREKGKEEEKPLEYSCSSLFFFPFPSVHLRSLTADEFIRGDADIDIYVENLNDDVQGGMATEEEIKREKR